MSPIPSLIELNSIMLHKRKNAKWIEKARQRKKKIIIIIIALKRPHESAKKSPPRFLVALKSLWFPYPPLPFHASRLAGPKAQIQKKRPARIC